MGKGDPKSILKRFVGEDSKLSILDVVTCKMKKCYPDSVFVKKNLHIIWHLQKQLII